MSYQPTPSSHESLNFVPRVERLVRHSMDYNRKVQSDAIRIIRSLVVLFRLQSQTFQ